MRLELKICAVLLPAAMLVFPAAAVTLAASPTTIDFEGYAEGTVLISQYDPVGVDFVKQGGSTPGAYPIVFMPSNGSAPHSGTNVAAIALSGETSVPLATANFTSPASAVNVYVGHLPDNQSDSATVTLTAYDSSLGGGTVIGSDSASVTEASGVHTLLSVDAGSADIESFTVSGGANDGGKLIAFDDLSFTLPVAPPSFGISPNLSNESVAEGLCVHDQITVTRNNGSAGNLTFSASHLPDGVTAEFSPNPSTGDVDMELCAEADAPPASSTATVTATPDDVPSEGASQNANVTVTVPVNCDKLTISGFNPTSGRPPISGRNGTPITVTGSNFCPGMTVEFGNTDAAVTVPTTSSTASFTADIPRLATTGPITLHSPDGSVSMSSTTTLGVTTFRATDGFAFGNDGAALSRTTGTQYAMNQEMAAVFGYNATHLSGNWCGPQQCPAHLDIGDPLARLFSGVADAQLSPVGGLAFGLAASSQMLVAKRVAYTSFPWQPGTVTPTVWKLLGPAGPSPALAQYVKEQQLRQLSDQFFHREETAIQANEKAAAARTDSALVKSQILKVLEAGKFPLINLAHVTSAGWEGHTLVAFNIEAAPGGYFIDCYDPDRAYAPAEFGNPALHMARENGSRVFVGANGHWTFSGSFPNGDDAWSGGPYSNPLLVYPLSSLPRNPRVPALTTNPAEAVSGPARLVQVTDAAGHAMFAGGTLNADPASRVPGAEPLNSEALTGGVNAQMVALGSQAQYSSQFLGLRTGTATSTEWGDGQLVQASFATRKAAGYRLSFNAATSTVSFMNLGSTPSSVTLDLAKQVSPSQIRLVRVQATAAPGRGTVSFTRGFSGAAFTGNWSGTAKFELSAWGSGQLPFTYTTTAKLRSGETVVVVPSSWTVKVQSAEVTTKLAGHKIVTTKAADVTSPTAALTVNAWAKRRKGKELLAVTGKVSSVVSGATGLIGWEVMKAGKVVFHTQLRVLRVTNRSHTYFVKAKLRPGKYTFRAMVDINAVSGGFPESTVGWAQKSFKH